MENICVAQENIYTNTGWPSRRTDAENFGQHADLGRGGCVISKHFY